MNRFVASLVLAAPLLFAAAPANADDESSAHTAQLIGDSGDTLGVTLRHDAKTGWSARVRAKPGAPQKTVALSFLPADHAHYEVVVGPKRAWLAIITRSRPQFEAKDVAIWVTTLDGTVKKSWRFGDIISDKERKSLPRSISHTQWLESTPTLKKGTVTLELEGKKVHIDPAKRTLAIRS